MMIDSIWDGKKFTPRMIGIFVGPARHPIHLDEGPSAGARFDGQAREMSRVRYRISGWPSLA